MSDHDYPPNTGQKDESGEEPVELTPAEQARNVDADSDSGEAARGPKSEAGGEAETAPAEAEIAALNDRLLRLAAELENTRRRTEREKSDARRFAIADFARDLIGVVDNFERALAAAGVTGADIPEGRSEAFKNLVSGIQMTEKELLTVLERHGVRRMESKGEKFDPHLHQAVAQVPSATIPAGHVVDVAQSGFTIGERVLRAAMVTVSSGAGASDDNAGPGAHVDREA
jgi:molecular chaperone GrpE